MAKKNLLEETIEDIARSGHAVEQIVFIGSERSGHSCTWDEFRSLADVTYDDGFGAQIVALDLVIVFSDGTKMWRHEYAGSEGWEYSTPFKMPKHLKPMSRLVANEAEVGWVTLANMNADR